MNGHSSGSISLLYALVKELHQLPVHKRVISYHELVAHTFRLFPRHWTNGTTPKRTSSCHCGPAITFTLSDRIALDLLQCKDSSYRTAVNSTRLDHSSHYATILSNRSSRSHVRGGDDNNTGINSTGAKCLAYAHASNTCGSLARPPSHRYSPGWAQALLLCQVARYCSTQSAEAVLLAKREVRLHDGFDSEESACESKAASSCESAVIAYVLSEGVFPPQGSSVVVRLLRRWRDIVQRSHTVSTAPRATTQETACTADPPASFPRALSSNTMQTRSCAGQRSIHGVANSALHTLPGSMSVRLVQGGTARQPLGTEHAYPPTMSYPAVNRLLRCLSHLRDGAVWREMLIVYEAAVCRGCALPHSCRSRSKPMEGTSGESRQYATRNRNSPTMCECHGECHVPRAARMPHDKTSCQDISCSSTCDRDSSHACRFVSDEEKPTIPPSKDPWECLLGRQDVRAYLTQMRQTLLITLLHDGEWGLALRWWWNSVRQWQELPAPVVTGHVMHVLSTQMKNLANVSESGQGREDLLEGGTRDRQDGGGGVRQRHESVCCCSTHDCHMGMKKNCRNDYTPESDSPGGLFSDQQEVYTNRHEHIYMSTDRDAVRRSIACMLRGDDGSRRVDPTDTPDEELPADKHALVGMLQAVWDMFDTTTRHIAARRRSWAEAVVADAKMHSTPKLSHHNIKTGTANVYAGIATTTTTTKERKKDDAHRMNADRGDVVDMQCDPSSNTHYMDSNAHRSKTKLYVAQNSSGLHETQRAARRRAIRQYARDWGTPISMAMAAAAAVCPAMLPMMFYRLQADVTQCFHDSTDSCSAAHRYEFVVRQGEPTFSPYSWGTDHAKLPAAAVCTEDAERRKSTNGLPSTVVAPEPVANLEQRAGSPSQRQTAQEEHSQGVARQTNRVAPCSSDRSESLPLCTMWHDTPLVLLDGHFLAALQSCSSPRTRERLLAEARACGMLDDYKILRGLVSRGQWEEALRIFLNAAEEMQARTSSKKTNTTPSTRRTTEDQRCRQQQQQELFVRQLGRPRCSCDYNNAHNIRECISSIDDSNNYTTSNSEKQECPVHDRRAQQAACSPHAAPARLSRREWGWSRLHLLHAARQSNVACIMRALHCGERLHHHPLCLNDAEVECVLSKSLETASDTSTLFSSNSSGHKQPNQSETNSCAMHNNADASHSPHNIDRSTPMSPFTRFCLAVWYVNFASFMQRLSGQTTDKDRTHDVAACSPRSTMTRHVQTVSSVCADAAAHPPRCDKQRERRPNMAMLSFLLRRADLPWMLALRLYRAMIEENTACCSANKRSCSADDAASSGRPVYTRPHAPYRAISSTENDSNNSREPDHRSNSANIPSSQLFAYLGIGGGSRDRSGDHGEGDTNSRMHINYSYTTSTSTEITKDILAETMTRLLYTHARAARSPATRRAITAVATDVVMRAILSHDSDQTAKRRGDFALGMSFLMCAPADTLCRIVLYQNGVCVEAGVLFHLLRQSRHRLALLSQIDDTTSHTEHSCTRIDNSSKAAFRYDSIRHDSSGNTSDDDDYNNSSSSSGGNDDRCTDASPSGCPDTNSHDAWHRCCHRSNNSIDSTYDINDASAIKSDGDRHGGTLHSVYVLPRCLLLVDVLARRMTGRSMGWVRSPWWSWSDACSTTNPAHRMRAQARLAGDEPPDTVCLGQSIAYECPEKGIDPTSHPSRACQNGYRRGGRSTGDGCAAASNPDMCSGGNGNDKDYASYCTYDNDDRHHISEMGVEQKAEVPIRVSAGNARWLDCMPASVHCEVLQVIRVLVNSFRRSMHTTRGGVRAVATTTTITPTTTSMTNRMSCAPSAPLPWMTGPTPHPIASPGSVPSRDGTPIGQGSTDGMMVCRPHHGDMTVWLTTRYMSRLFESPVHKRGDETCTGLSLTAAETAAWKDAKEHTMLQNGRSSDCAHRTRHTLYTAAYEALVTLVTTPVKDDAECDTVYRHDNHDPRIEATHSRNHSNPCMDCHGRRGTYDNNTLHKEYDFAWSHPSRHPASHVFWSSLNLFVNPSLPTCLQHRCRLVHTLLHQTLIEQGCHPPSHMLLTNQMDRLLPPRQWHALRRSNAPFRHAAPHVTKLASGVGLSDTVTWPRCTATSSPVLDRTRSASSPSTATGTGRAEYAVRTATDGTESTPRTHPAGLLSHREDTDAHRTPVLPISNQSTCAISHGDGCGNCTCTTCASSPCTSRATGLRCCCCCGQKRVIHSMAHRYCSACYLRTFAATALLAACIHILQAIPAAAAVETFTPTVTATTAPSRNCKFLADQVTSTLTDAVSLHGLLKLCCRVSEYRAATRRTAHTHATPTECCVPPSCPTRHASGLGDASTLPVWSGQLIRWHVLWHGLHTLTNASLRLLYHTCAAAHDTAESRALKTDAWQRALSLTQWLRTCEAQHPPPQQTPQPYVLSQCYSAHHPPSPIQTNRTRQEGEHKKDVRSTSSHSITRHARVAPAHSEASPIASQHRTRVSTTNVIQAQHYHLFQELFGWQTALQWWYTVFPKEVLMRVAHHRVAVQKLLDETHMEWQSETGHVTK